MALKLVVEPPSKIIVEHLDMRSGNAYLRLRKGSLEVGRITPDAEYFIGFQRLECTGATVGVRVDSTKIEAPILRSLKMVGGNGVELEGTGIAVGIGAATMTILGLSIEHATKHFTNRLHFPFDESMKGYSETLPPRI